MDDESDPELPASVERAWGMADRPRRGPKPGLSLTAIVDAAVALAGREGISAVSMGRVAREVRASPMSLYRYVAAKDELLALMIDAASGPPPADPADRDGWRSGLTRWAWGYLEALRRHPWMLRIPISGPPVTPNQVAWLEYGLQALRATGLEPGEKLSIMLLLSGYVRNDATIAADIGAAVAAVRVPDAEIMPSWRRLIERLADVERFPELRAVAASGVLDRDDHPDEEFVFGLDRVLDGVEALVRARAG